MLSAGENCVEILSREDPVLEEGTELTPAHVGEFLSLVILTTRSGQVRSGQVRSGLCVKSPV